jgi:hypothetical protein
VEEQTCLSGLLSIAGVNPTMSILADLKMYARFAWGLRGFLRETITLEEAKAIVRKRLAEREDNFLRLVEKGIFGYPRSPYLPLLRLAQVELGDIQNMVRRKGLEDTLRALREAGVYVTFEEFKGREPMVREGMVVSVQPHDFDNPYLTRYYKVETGGTSGAGTRVEIDLEHLAAQAPPLKLAQEAHGLLDVPTGVWLAILPDSGLGSMLQRAHFGQVPLKWFSPIVIRDSKPSLKYGLPTYGAVALGRLLGVSIPWPESVRLDEAIVVARWATETVGTYGRCLIITHVSKALRVCVAAREAGLDLTGTVLWGSGEPPTAAKVRAMTAVGARWIPSYWFTEAGAVALGCARPADVNDNHFLKDALALIQHPHRVSETQITVPVFYFTTLLPTTPKLMLNVESGDYGVIEHRSCGCPLETYGYTEHLRHIHAVRKLTGEGVTLVGSEMVHILEQVLPARFGGSPLDYQLLEEEDEQGFTRLSLLVNPKIEIEDEQEVVNAVLDALRQGSVAAGMTRAIWSQAKALRVKRMAPIWTDRGKLMPLRTVQRPRERKRHD